MSKVKQYGIIYKATNLFNGKVYIGLTTSSLKKRKKGHGYSAENNSGNSQYFMRAIRKYGIDGFSWEEIDSAHNREELVDKEIYWIKKYKSYGENGYNMTKGGEGVVGLKRDDEFRKEKSELVHKLRKEGKMGASLNKPVILDEDVLSVRDLILKGVDLNCIASIYNVGVSSVISLKRGVVKRAMLTDTDLYNMSLIRQGLNEEKVIEIKELIIQGSTLKNIADIYDVSRCAISAIKLGNSWRHVFTEEDMKAMDDAIPVIPKRILCEEELLEIKYMLLEGLSNKEVAKEIDCKPNTISSIRRGEKHKYLFTEEELNRISFKPKNKS